MPVGQLPSPAGLATPPAGESTATDWLAGCGMFNRVEHSSVVQCRLTTCQLVLNMNAKNNLLDKARDKCQPKTDMELAARVGVSRSAVSMWRKGGTITSQHLEALATLAGVDGQAVIEVMEEQAVTPAQKRVWQSVLNRLSAAAAAITVIVLLPATSVGKANEISTLQKADSHSLYIM